MQAIQRRRLMSSFAVAALAAALPAAAWSQAQGAKYKAVFQVSDGDAAKWNLVLNNVRNAQEDLGRDNVELEVVVFGPGIGMLKSDSPVGTRVAEAVKGGIKVVACENTMRNLKLVSSDMLQTIGYVSSGVTELMKKQQQGYAYVRP